MEQIAKVSRGRGGDGFTPRTTETRTVTLGGYYARQGDKKRQKVTPYVVGDIVRAGPHKGFLVTVILQCECTNCGQWQRDGDCYNQCAKRGFAE